MLMTGDTIQGKFKTRRTDVDSQYISLERLILAHGWCLR